LGVNNTARQIFAGGLQATVTAAEVARRHGSHRTQVRGVDAAKVRQFVGA